MNAEAYTENFAALHLPVEHVSAFHWRVEPEVKVLTAHEKALIYARKYFKDRYVPAAKKTSKLTAVSPRCTSGGSMESDERVKHDKAEMKRKALRVNPESHLGYAGKPGLGKAAI